MDKPKRTIGGILKSIFYSESGRKIYVVVTGTISVILIILLKVLDLKLKEVILCCVLYAISDIVGQAALYMEEYREEKKRLKKESEEVQNG